MINPQLLQYVRQQRANGVSKEDITKALSGGGWSAADAAEAFAAIEGVRVAPAAPQPQPAPTPAQSPRVAPQPAAQPQPQPRPAAPATTPASVRVQPAAVVQRQPAYAKVKKRRVWPWLLLSLLMLLGGLVGGLYLSVLYPWLLTYLPNVNTLAPVNVAEQRTPASFLDTQFGTGVEEVDETAPATPSEEE